MEIKVNWNDLSYDEQMQAIETYRYIRENEEETKCSFERAKNETPFCKGFYRQEDGYIFVDVWKEIKMTIVKVYCFVVFIISLIIDALPEKIRNILSGLCLTLLSLSMLILIKILGL